MGQPIRCVSCRNAGLGQLSGKGPDTACPAGSERHAVSVASTLQHEAITAYTSVTAGCDPAALCAQGASLAGAWLLTCPLPITAIPLPRPGLSSCLRGDLGQRFGVARGPRQTLSYHPRELFEVDGALFQAVCPDAKALTSAEGGSSFYLSFGSPPHRPRPSLLPSQRPQPADTSRESAPPGPRADRGGPASSVHPSPGRLTVR